MAGSTGLVLAGNGDIVARGWNVDAALACPDALTSGTYKASVLQAMGTHESEPVGIDFGVAAVPGAPMHTPTPTPAQEGSDHVARPTIPIGAVPAKGTLASTGAESPVAAISAGLLVALLGAILVLRARRCRARATPTE